MENVLIILAVVLSVLLVIVVLIQKSKGGGLASNFSGSNQIMGVRRTNDFVEKTTWTLAAIIAVLAILSGMLFNFGGKKSSTLLESPVQQETPATFETEAGETAEDAGIALPDADNSAATAETTADETQAPAQD